MSTLATGVTGIFFDTAREVLKTVLRAVLDSHVRQLTETHVRQILLDHLERAAPRHQIAIEQINILLREVYSVANATTDLEVREKTINLREPSRIPAAHREEKIRHDVATIRSAIVAAMQQSDTPGLIEECTKTEQAPSPQPLIFEPPSARAQKDIPTSRHRDEILSTYRQRIQSVIDDEDDSAQ